MQPGDLIYGVETNGLTGEVTIKTAVISLVTPKTVKTNVYASGFGLECRTTHKRDDVFVTAEQALRAYRDRVVNVLLSMQRQVDRHNTTLMSIDRLLGVRG